MKSPIMISKGPHSAPRAFTLIELLVVAAILVVLVLFALPALYSLRDRARGVVCMNNIRQMASVLLAYNSDHNGFFPPGYPVRRYPISKEDEQPDAPPQPGMGGYPIFTTTLVPEYIASLPLCPSQRLTPSERVKYPGEKEYKKIRSYGGSYGINAILAQWKLNRMPYPGWPPSVPYSSAMVPFVMETGCTNITWDMTHQNQALDGVDGYKIAGRNHGGTDGVNFMFLDGHMKMIRRDDQRGLPSKTWGYPTNPNGQFTSKPSPPRYVMQTILSNTEFSLYWPQYGPIQR